MEAKNTVIKDVKRIDALFYYKFGFPMVDKLLLAQAEISFKVGEEYGIGQHYDREIFCYNKGKKAGIREAVEWIDKHQPYMAFYCKEEWQAKLKEWGIDDNGRR